MSSIEDLVIGDLNAIHGGKYTYARLNYKNAKGNIVVTCPAHGDFEVSLRSHRYRKSGCRKCADEVRSKRFTKTNIRFIADAKRIHGDRYDYSKTVYTKARGDVVITCNVHGDFTIIAQNHTRGTGCLKCTGLHRYTTNQWVEEAAKKHGDKYDYLKAVYVRALDKVIITCKIHGDFEQLPSSHLRGDGCPRCFFNRDQPASVYLMQMGEQVKIGISIDPDARLGQLNRNNSKHASILTTWTLEDFPSAFNAEQQIHRELAGFNAGLSGFDGATEWFDTTPEYATTVIERILKPTTTNRDAPLC